MSWLSFPHTKSLLVPTLLDAQNTPLFVHLIFAVPLFPLPPLLPHFCVGSSDFRPSVVYVSQDNVDEFLFSAAALLCRFYRTPLLTMHCEVSTGGYYSLTFRSVLSRTQL